MKRLICSSYNPVEPIIHCKIMRFGWDFYYEYIPFGLYQIMSSNPVKASDNAHIIIIQYIFYNTITTCITIG